MYIFKYHRDNAIYRDGFFVSSFADFMAANPDFPLVEGEFFELREDCLHVLNAHGHGIPDDEARFKKVKGRIVSALATLDAKTAAEKAAKDAQWQAGAARRNIIEQIRQLESQVTNIRIMEAILGVDNGWLANQYNLITTEKNKLGE